MRKILFSLSLVISCLTFGQKIDFKDDFVIINGKKCFKFESKRLGDFSTFYSLEGKKLFYIDAQRESFYKIGFSGIDDYATLYKQKMNQKKEFLGYLIDE